ncbi:MAG: D-serine ammonia-lyase [Caulobacter sp.]
MSDVLALGNAETLARLRRGQGAVWMRPSGPVTDRAATISMDDVDQAVARMTRFRPVLRRLFPDKGWDGRIVSPLLDYPAPPIGLERLLVKADHDLPVTGSIKARGGIYELLCRIERIALAEGLIEAGGDYEHLLAPDAVEVMARHTVVVASTGNLGYSIGLAARAFGLNAEVHMSHDAKAWKKERLVRLGAKVVEHDCDYSLTVARARAAASACGAQFIDDEASRELMIGYAMAADELIGQLRDQGVQPSPARPLIVYLPCGVGGAPGGVTFGLKARLGEAVICVFVEPVASACVLAALAVGGGEPVSVYDVGLDNRTLADGLAVPLASRLVLDTVGDKIDAVVALTDETMTRWVSRAWREARLRLEPSAAASIAAVGSYLQAASDLRDLSGAHHVAWTTGGSLLPQDEFELLIAD